MQVGRVLKSTGSWYSVELPDGKTTSCRIRGKLRTQGLRSTNPVAVGDLVELAFEGEDCMITGIRERRNFIIRKSVNLSKESHILAANLDQAILVATRKDPITFATFIDRFCVAAESYHIPIAILFNKVDLLNDDEMESLHKFASIYQNLGYRTIFTSATLGQGKDELRELLKGKISLLSGNSGVGKSSLINALYPEMNLKIGEISSSHGTGQHTTTFAEMHPLPDGGYIIDTPGIRGFGILNIEKEELAGYFPEMRDRLPDCKFYNCVHLMEPGCAVKEAAANGEIAESRYKSYLSMYEEEAETGYR